MTNNPEIDQAEVLVTCSLHFSSQCLKYSLQLFCSIDFEGRFIAKAWSECEKEKKKGKEMQSRCLFGFWGFN